jgi:hypothetical protein
MSFIDVAVAIGFEGTAATVASGAMMGGAMTAGSNIIHGRNPFDNIGQGMLMGGFTAGVSPWVGETLGIGSAAATGLTAGALGYATTGDIGKGLTAGLSAYGLSNLASSMETAGGQQLANADTIANAETAANAARLAPDAEIAFPEGASNQAIEQFKNANAQDVETAGNATPRTTAEQIKTSMRNQGMSEEAIRAKFAEAGKSAVAENPMSFLKANAKNIMSAASPIFADQAVQSKMPQITTKPGMIRPYSYDPYSGRYTAYDPYEATPTKAADGGLMGYGESSNAPITQRNIDAAQNTDGMFNYAKDGGPALHMARGGLAALAFADGGGIDMFSPYVDLLAHPEKSGFIPGAERDAYMADIQAKQDELNQRIINRQTMGGGTAQPINWQQSPSGLNPSITQPKTAADIARDNDLAQQWAAIGDPFKTGGGGPATDAEYQKMVALETAKRNAENAAQDAYQISPDSPFYEASKVAIGDRLNLLKNSAYEYDQQQKNRAALAAANPGNGGFIVTPPDSEGYNYGSSKFGVTSKDYLPNVKATTNVPTADTNNAPAGNTSGSQASDALRSQATQQLLKDTGAYAVVGAPFAGSDGLAYNGPAPSKDVVDQAWAKYYATLNGSGAPTAGASNVPTSGTTNAPAAGTNTPSATQQYKDQHLVDPTTGHLLNPTLTAQQLAEAKNNNTEMRQAYDSYWSTVKPGDILDFAGGTLTMNPNGTATHVYTGADGKQHSYTFDKSTDFATVAISDPNIAKEWKDMFNYTTPSGGGGGGTVTPPPPPVVVQPNIPHMPSGGFTGMTDVRNAYTAGGGSLGYTPYVPTSMDDFNAKYNKLTGGSKQAYDVFTGKTKYSPTPYTETGEIMKPYAESVLGIPQDITTKKYLFDPATKQYKLNPAYVPPKYVTNAAQTATGNTGPANELKDRNNVPKTDPGVGMQWQWNEDLGTWEAVQVAARGGLMALARGGTAHSPFFSKTTGKFNLHSPQVYADGGMAAGGQYNLGGYSDGGRLLRGPGDGVSDSIPATIGNRQPAKLADGEFVVPARIVSELGNGSTEAGARKLYAMMDRVQSARRQSIGKGNVAKNSRADKHLPA